MRYHGGTLVKYSKSVLQAHIVFLLSLSSSVVLADSASCTIAGNTNTCTGEFAVYDQYRLNHTNVVINNNGFMFGVSPDVKGVGIYASQQLTANNLTVTTNGFWGTDAIRTQGSGSLTVTGKLIVRASGSSGDAINATINSRSTVNTGDNSEIYSKGGVAVRANLGKYTGWDNLINVGKNAIIQTDGNGTNASSASGYAVYAGNRDSESEGNPAGSAKVTIGDNSTITTKGNNAYAVYANKTGHIQLSSTVIQTTGSNAHGIAATDGSVRHTSSGTVTNYTGGKVDLLGDTTITVDPTKNSYAIYASGVGSNIASYNSDTSTQTATKFNVTGDMVVKDGGTIDLRMTSGSYFEGNSAITGTGGTLNLNIAGANSTWKMSKSSELTDLILSNNANVILGEQSTAVVTTNKVVLTVQNLSGNGHFQMRTNVIGTGLGASNIGDLLKVTGSSAGNHLVTVTDYWNGSAAVDGSERLKVVETTDGNASFTLNHAGQYVDIGAYKYYLNPGDTGYGEDTNHWHLSATPRGPSPLNNTADHSVNILNINYLLNYAETQTLLNRMGALRQSRDKDWDFWVRGFAGRMSSFSSSLSGFDMDYQGFQAGLDRRFEVNGNDLYVGVMAGTATAKADYEVGHGDTKSYHAGVYGTYITQNDFYVDAIAKYTVMKNDFNTETGGGFQVNGDGDTKGYTLGIETGKRFYIDSQAKAGWYIEPQAQLTYSHQDSAKINSSNGLTTKLDNFDSILGRASAIVGYNISQGKTPVDVYLKTGYVKEFDGKTGYSFNGVANTHDTYKFNGNWWENGVGVNINVDKRHNIYAEADYAKGSKFNNKSIRLGYRLSF